MHVHINGALVEVEEASIAADDRGFRFGDGVFETIAVYGGIPYLWEYHMERLSGGLEALKIRCTIATLLPHVMSLLTANIVYDGIVRIQISRGVGSQGYLPIPPQSPTLVMHTLARPVPLSQPVTLWLSAHEKISPKALPTRYKLAQGVSSTLARLEAAEHDCYDALQLGPGGIIAETSSANIFWRKDGTLYTPTLDSGALGGVTRRRSMELSPYPVREGAYTLYDLAGAEAAILTNASSGVIPIAALKEHVSFPQSRELAEAMGALREADIRRDTAHLRESLARS